MPRPPVRRPASRSVLTAATVLAVGATAAGASQSAGASQYAGARASASTGGSTGASYSGYRRHRATANPYSPAYRHSYRRGVVPSLGRLRRMRSWAGRRVTGARAFAGTELSYGGGIDGIGVSIGREKVYLVFWGAQWGTAGRDSSGDLTLSGDQSGAAPYLQRLFKGLGRGGETWSGVATQYCQGVPAGATSCPAGNRQHVAYPTGGALAGVWADDGAAAPSRATGHQIGAEAVRTAAHFGNATARANRNAQYLILSPPGTHPDGFNTASGDFCGWHDWNGDRTLPGGPVTSRYGHIAFTNLPYVTDAGRACGQDFVNHGQAGLLDGVSIVGGHEYAETITDQDPPAGWTDQAGDETADLCQWNSGPGARSADLILPTGTFAMQPLWVNGTMGTPAACELSHPVVTDGGGGGGGGGGGDTVTVASPGDQQTLRYGAVSLPITATDSSPGQPLSYASTGLPPGLTIASTTGRITGRPTTVGIYGVRVTATDPTGATGSATFTWTVTAGAGFLASLLANFPGRGQWIPLAGAQDSPRPGAGFGS